MHVFRTRWAPSDLVSLQPIYQPSRDADACSQWRRRVTGSTWCSSVQSMCCEQAFSLGLMYSVTATAVISGQLSLLSPTEREMTIGHRDQWRAAWRVLARRIQPTAQNGRRLPFWKSNNRNVSAKIWPISTKFSIVERSHSLHLTGRWKILNFCTSSTAEAF